MLRLRKDIDIGDWPSETATAQVSCLGALQENECLHQKLNSTAATWDFECACFFTSESKSQTLKQPPHLVLKEYPGTMGYGVGGYPLWYYLIQPVM